MKEKGLALISVMYLMAGLAALLSAYAIGTRYDLLSTMYSRNTVTGFYSAEGGLNIRAEKIREIFVGFNRPGGISPNSQNACIGQNRGTGDFACEASTINRRKVETYVEEHENNPIVLTVPPGERYQNLNAQEYRYTARSTAFGPVHGHPEALLELKFKSRLVPLFQFAAFYNKDLEILPGPTMTLSGPVHTNGDLYLMSDGNSLTISGQVTSAKDIYRGRKNTTACTNDPVNVFDPLNARSLIPSCPRRTKVDPRSLNPWHGMIVPNVSPVTVPGPEIFDSTPGALYWDKADMRLVLNVDSSGNKLSLEVADSGGNRNVSQTNSFLGCAGSVNGKAADRVTMHNFREAKTVYLLEVDIKGLLNCLKSTNWLGTGKQLNDSSEGGLVFHFTVKGIHSLEEANDYGVRLYQGAELKSTINGAPAIKGMTVVSDQAMYLRGSYNSVNKKPAAIMADSLNILSNSWNDSNSNRALASRIASDTTINSAFLAGTDKTGDREGASGQDRGNYNGGLENYPRFHEDWSGRTLKYRGSFVSLGVPQHVRGTWSSQSYSPPNRDWNYDTSFNNAANLPPITPRFVYLRQELFVRDFES